MRTWRRYIRLCRGNTVGKAHPTSLKPDTVWYIVKEKLPILRTELEGLSGHAE